MHVCIYIYVQRQKINASNKEKAIYFSHTIKDGQPEGTHWVESKGEREGEREEDRGREREREEREGGNSEAKCPAFIELIIRILIISCIS